MNLRRKNSKRNKEIKAKTTLRSPSGHSNRPLAFAVCCHKVNDSAYLNTTSTLTDPQTCLPAHSLPHCPNNCSMAS
jgi:hypothetical protein